MDYSLNTKAQDALKLAFREAGVDESLAVLRVSNRPDLCDFQCNGLLQFKNPELCQRVADMLSENTIFSSVSVAGAGFLNIVIADDFLIDCLILNAVQKASSKETVVIDYGGPNIAKPLHVGHLRSAIIGESLKRIAKKLGHTVIADVHLGDWGTPMGMLIAYIADENLVDLSADSLNEIYPVAAKRFKEDEAFADKARRATLLLQTDAKSSFRKLWTKIRKMSVEKIKEDFDLIDVCFDKWSGESDSNFYVSQAEMVLFEAGLLVQSEGALVVKFGDKPPLIFSKKDGAATYAATDLATIFARIEDNSPDKILYVVDKRQELYFKQIFSVMDSLKGGSLGGILYKEDDTLAPMPLLEHIGFGTVNGADGKPYKTRDGGVMKLSDFVQQAIEMATVESGYEGKEIDTETKGMIEKIAIGAIKFADLSNPRMSDYIFNVKEAVKFIGKTGPYVQYAYVRAMSILSKVPMTDDHAAHFSSKTERDLAKILLQYQKSLQDAFNKRRPDILCEYAYNVAKSFSNFYAECDVLYEENAGFRSLRLVLVRMAAETLKNSLACLGIPVPEKMVRAVESDSGV